MSTILETKDGVAVVVVRSDSLISANASELQADIEAALEENKRIVVDMRQVQFIDSSGCGALLSTIKELKNLGGKVAACQITRSVRALFELIRMPLVLPIFTSRAEAIEALAA